MYKYIFLLIYFSSAWGNEIELIDSNLPIIIIDTFDETILNEPKITASMKIIHNDTINNISDIANHYDGMIGIELRGHSSLSFPKKQYSIETRDSTGNNLNVSLFGMPEENDWILYAPYSDKSLIRNIVAYHIARSLGFYAPRTQLCEVILNGEYLGVYVFTEKIKKDNGRVNVGSPSDNNITGGYILEVEAWSRLDSSDIYFSNDISNKPYVIHFPKETDLTQNQINYIHDYLFTFDSALLNDNAFLEYINVPSWVDFLLLNEVFKNNDTFFSSTYLYKKTNDKLFAGPIWDYNISFGNIDYNNNWPAEGWLETSNFWSPKLLEDYKFSKTFKIRWKNLRSKQLSNESVLAIIDSLVIDLDGPQQRNFLKWPILGEYVWPNHFIGSNYLEEIEYLTTWVQNRFSWIDDQFIDFEMKYPIINEINYNSNFYFNTEDWVELYNPYSFPIDISKYVFKDMDDENIFTFPENLVIHPFDYKILCKDTTKLKNHYQGIQNYIGNFDFSLSNNGELIRLYDSLGSLIDYVNYDDSAPWPINADGNGSTLQLKDYPRDNFHYSNWWSGLGHGTPGNQNIIILQNSDLQMIKNQILLYNNYPNPFNDRTTIIYDLPKFSFVEIIIYDLKGSVVNNIVNSNQSPGKKSVKWNATNTQGQPVSAGVYLYSIEAGKFRQTKKMILLK